MIQVTQTKVSIHTTLGESVQNGNCFAAVVASILEVPITEVPNVETLFHIEGYWMEVMCRFLNSKGYELREDNRFRVFHPKHENELPQKLKQELNKQFYLVTGKSPRGINHVCIYQNGVMVHDPYPTREGLLTENYFEVIEKLNPGTGTIPNDKINE